MSEQVSTNRKTSAETQLPTLTPTQARQRASVVIITVGIIQLVGTLLPYLAVTKSAGLDSTDLTTTSAPPLTGWTITLFTAALVYLLSGIPIRFNFKPAIWLGMTAALAQAGVFASLTLIGIVAGLRNRDPATLTMGVLLFGSIASIHLFVLRWLWQAR